MRSSDITGCGPRGRFEINLPEAPVRHARRAAAGRAVGDRSISTSATRTAAGAAAGAAAAGAMFECGELRLVLLKLIADEPRHGYDLIRAIEELTGGEYAPSPGVVYPTLTLLQDMGLIEEAAGEGPRKPFQVTEEGRTHLEEHADEVEALFERLRRFDAARADSAGPAIGRAVKNLMTALSHRIGRDGLDEDLLHEIAAILDEAAQKIERVKLEPTKSLAASHPGQPLALDDRVLVDAEHRRVDRVPVHRLGDGEPRLAVAAAQLGIAGISLERVGEPVDVAGVDQHAGLTVADQVGRAGRFRGDDRQRAGHRFQRDVAERFGDRRIEEHVRARERAGEISPRLLADENRVGQLLLEPRPRRTFADHQHAMLDPAFGRRRGSHRRRRRAPFP